eukprot:6214812-Pleurochrysis_carterae.AAC.1
MRRAVRAAPAPASPLATSASAALLSSSAIVLFLTRARQEHAGGMALAIRSGQEAAIWDRELALDGDAQFSNCIV